jgi:hypothetical protein
MAKTRPTRSPPSLGEISDKIDALSDGAERWLPEDLACAGCVIGIGHGGKLAVERGLVRPEDEPDETHEAGNVTRRQHGNRRRHPLGDMADPVGQGCTSDLDDAVRLAAGAVFR